MPRSDIRRHESRRLVVPALLLFCVVGTPTAAGAQETGTSQQAGADSRNPLVAAGIISPDEGEPSVDAVLRRATEQIDSLSAPEASAVAAGVATMLTTANRLSQADDWYVRAIELSDGTRRSELLLEHARVHLQLGDTEAARAAARRARDADGRRETRVRAIALMAESYAAEGRDEEAQDILRGVEVVSAAGSLPPSLLFQMYELATRLSQDREAQRIAERIRSEFPSSPEAMLLESDGERRVIEALSPRRLVYDTRHSPADDADSTQDNDSGPSEGGDGASATARPEGSGTDASGIAAYNVQVGSFRDVENARYMRRDMEELGFSATVRETTVNGESYFQVLIPVDVGENEAPQQAVQPVVVRLKERGYEGFLVTE